MVYAVVKITLTALIVWAVSEIAKRSTVFGALIASLPLTSLLAFVWIYIETGESATIAALARDILWLVMPSLLLFVVFPALLDRGWNFWLALAAGCLATAGAYGLTVWMRARVLATG